MEAGKIFTVLAALGGFLLLTKKASASEETISSAKIQVEIRDDAGNIVPHNSPYDLLEGGNYSIGYSVTNQSTRGGNAWSAPLYSVINVAIDSSDLVWETDDSDYAPGQTKSFGPFPFTVPIGNPGLNRGNILASVSVGPGPDISSAIGQVMETINVVEVAVSELVSGSINIQEPVYEGDNATISWVITNQSTKAGMPWAFNLHYIVDIYTETQDGGIHIPIITIDRNVSLTPGQQIEASEIVPVEWNFGGLFLSAQINMFYNDGNWDSAFDQAFIEWVPIEYRADIILS